MDADSGKKSYIPDLNRVILSLDLLHISSIPRSSVLLLTFIANIDASLMRFLQKYFPKETKAKQKENEIAAGVDLYGESYTDAKCIVM
jgi:hypothetical protein